MDLVRYEFGTPGRRTLLLVHGLTEAGTTWPDAVEHWSDAYHLVTYDQRGHGSSPRFRTAELAHTPDVWLADLIDVLRSLPEPPVVVGHSLGGLMTLRAAAAEPHLARAVVLEDPARPSGAWAPSPDFVEAQEEFLDRVSGDPDGESARMAIESHWSPAEIEGWAASKAQVDRTMIRRGLFLGDPEFESLLNGLAVPTLVVVPVDGEMAPRREEVTNPLVGFAEIPDAGHCVRRDNPAAFYAAVDAFLAGLPGW